jgi:beta-lactamase regulating signal transducer with metallopeptidase domain
MNAALGYVASALLHGTMVAAAIWALERLLRTRITPTLSCALWTIALLKFLVPIGPASFTTRPLPVVFDALVVSGTSAVAPETTSTWPWSFAVMALYGLLLVVLAARQGLARWRLARMVEALPEASDEVMVSVREAAVALGLETLPSVRMGAGPFIFGLWSPTLVVPAQAATRAMLVHELAHLRRRDHWVLAVQQVAQLLFFFWPPVRWVNRQIAHFRELACDVLAIEHGSLSPAAYARVLLDAQRSALGLSHALTTLEMSSRSSRIEWRITMLLQRTHHRSSTWAVLSVLCGAALALTGTAFAADGGGANTGTVDSAAIEQVVAAHVDELTACFEAQLRWSPLLSGTLVYDWDIKPDGTVGGACRGDGTTFNPAVSPEVEDALTVCIGHAVKTWKFPAPRGGSASVSWPFKFIQQAPPLRSQSSTK